MRATEIGAVSWNRNLLRSVLLELTYRCNLDCFYCYNDLGLQGKPVATERYLDLLEELAEIGVFELVLSGGEPLAHPDFLQLGRRARDLGFVVRIKSNGHALSESWSRLIKQEIDPFVVDVSLHGSTAEVHDRQTRVPGSFDRLIDNLRIAGAAGLRLKLNATLTRWNEHQIEGMFAQADELGLPLRFFTGVTPKDDGDTEPLRISPSDEAIRALQRIQSARIAVAEEGKEQEPPPPVDKNCGAGASNLTVDPFGNVYPCTQWRRAFGNLNDSTVAEIWNDSPAIREVREINQEVKRRREESTGFEASVPHCMGLSELKWGDPFATDTDRVHEARVRASTQSSGALLPVVR